MVSPPFQKGNCLLDIEWTKRTSILDNFHIENDTFCQEKLFKKSQKFDLKSRALKKSRNGWGGRVSNSLPEAGRFECEHKEVKLLTAD